MADDTPDPTRFLFVEPGIYQRGPHFWLRFTLPLPSGGAKRYQLPARWPMRRGVRAANVTEARRFYKLILGHLQGEAAAERRKGGPTVADLCEKFLSNYYSEDIRDLAAYRADSRALLAHVSKHLGSVRAEKLTTDDVLDLLRALKTAGKADQTRLHVLHKLVKVIEWGCEAKLLTRRDNPARLRKDKRPRVPSNKSIAPERHLSAAECSQLLSWASEHAPSDAALYATAIYTGMRQGNLLRLRWPDVNFADQMIFLRETKIGEPHATPMHPALRTILRAWRKQPEHRDDGLVFPEADGEERVPVTVRRRFAKALAGAGVRSVRFHDLRHTAASLLAASGSKVEMRMEIIGWKSIQSAMRYTHLEPSDVSAAVGRVKLPRPRRPKRGT